MSVSKYRAQAVEEDGLRFASKREAARYRVLRDMEKKGEISGLELQPRFPLSVNGERICTYVGDFRYWENGVQVIEDVKGVKTPVYRLKKKLLKACHGLTIRET